MEQESEAYSEPCQASKMEPSVKIFSQKATQSFTIFAKNFILDIWQVLNTPPSQNIITRHRAMSGKKSSYVRRRLLHNDTVVRREVKQFFL